MPGEHRNRGSNRDPSVAKGTKLTVVQRTQILTLFTLANWPKRRISRELGLAESTVRLTIKQGTTTPHRPSVCKVFGKPPDRCLHTVVPAA